MHVCQETVKKRMLLWYYAFLYTVSTKYINGMSATDIMHISSQGVHSIPEGLVLGPVTIGVMV